MEFTRALSHMGYTAVIDNTSMHTTVSSLFLVATYITPRSDTKSVVADLGVTRSVIQEVFCERRVTHSHVTLAVLNTTVRLFGCQSAP